MSFKSLSFLLALAYAFLLGCAYASDEDETAIRALIEERRVAWNAQDTDAYSRILTEDADIWSATGRSAYGREEVIKLYLEQRKGTYRTANISSTQVTRIKLVRPEVALVDAEGELTGARSSDGAMLPPIKGQVLFLVVRENGRWLISSIRGVTRIPSQAR